MVTTLINIIGIEIDIDLNNIDTDMIDMIEIVISHIVLFAQKNEGKQSHC
jgi:hypothetical protein